jgi:hypothetical protein
MQSESTGFKESKGVCDAIERILRRLRHAGSKWWTFKAALHFAGVLLFLMLLSPSMSAADSVTLAWDENSEPDVAGYRIYYRTGSPGSGMTSGYDGVGLEEGDSPIDLPIDEDGNLDPRLVEVDLNELDENEDYYFIVTAYNTEGLESGPSNEAALVRGVATESSSSQVAASESGGGGGGGCFITTASGSGF